MTHPSDAEERCWRYLLANRQATAEDVVLNCDVTEVFAEALMARISSPNWREPVEGVKFDADRLRFASVQIEKFSGATLSIRRSF